MEFFRKSVKFFEDYGVDEFLNDDTVKKIFSPVKVGEETDETKMSLKLKIGYGEKIGDNEYGIKHDHIVFVRGTNSEGIREFFHYEDKVRYFFDLIKQRGYIISVVIKG